MKKITTLIISLALGLVALPVKAVCPVCTIAVGAGVGLAQWLGIDDTVTGLWIGALIVSLTLWTTNWLKTKNISFRLINLAVGVVYVLIVGVPLYYQNIIGHPYNTLWGIDKLVLGGIIGAVTFYLTAKWYLKLKEKNNGRAHFPFQKIVMSLVALALLSVIFYFLTK